MKNTLEDLNNHLFAQMERLSDEDLSPEELQKEIERSKAVTTVANAIVSNGRLALDAQTKLAPDNKKAAPKMLGVGLQGEQPGNAPK
jgi:hypothetical protein